SRGIRDPDDGGGEDDCCGGGVGSGF
ncbi:hypothetical protein Tco_0994889, partial [Tanacetum coccineum]